MFDFQLLDKPWSQVSFLLLPGTCLHFYRKEGSAFPTLVGFHQILAPDPTRPYPTRPDPTRRYSFVDTEYPVGLVYVSVLTSHFFSLSRGCWRVRCVRCGR